MDSSHQSVPQVTRIRVPTSWSGQRQSTPKAEAHWPTLGTALLEDQGIGAAATSLYPWTKPRTWHPTSPSLLPAGVEMRSRPLGLGLVQ